MKRENKYKIRKKNRGENKRKYKKKYEKSKNRKMKQKKKEERVFRKRKKNKKTEENKKWNLMNHTLQPFILCWTIESASANVSTCNYTFELGISVK